MFYLRSFLLADSAFWKQTAVPRLCPIADLPIRSSSQKDGENPRRPSWASLCRRARHPESANWGIERRARSGGEGSWQRPFESKNLQHFGKTLESNLVIEMNNQDH